MVNRRFAAEDTCDEASGAASTITRYLFDLDFFSSGRRGLPDLSRPKGPSSVIVAVHP